MTLSVLDAIEDHRLFEQQNRLVRLAPFAISYAAALVPWERIPAPSSQPP